jgi:hypothetical protein
MDNITGLTLDVIQNFISNLGFPIFMCLYFMYSQRKAENRHDKVLDEIKCLETQIVESKLQVGQVLNNVPPQAQDLTIELAKEIAPNIKKKKKKH